MLKKAFTERSLLSEKILLKKFLANAMFAGKISRAIFIGLGLQLSSQCANVLANPVTPALPKMTLPTNGQVVAGSATISQSQTATSATMNVNQTSQRAVINWDSFNVGKNATVNFNQPNANSVTLNRVTSTTASMIEGAVNANGQVIFVNPNGVTFGKGAEVNAAGVVATTMDISNQDFMDGKSTYNGNGSGKVVNKGTIQTNVNGGYIALLAPEVQNQGYLLATKGSGTVAMGAGAQITLNFQGSSLIGMKVDVATYNALIANKHIVEVNGGLVVMAASAANQLSASIIKNTGKISASSAVNNGGVIELVANTVTQAGKVEANSQAVQGGQINIVGQDITLAKNSKTSATGATGGGHVLIGLSNSQVSGGTQAPINTNSSVSIQNQSQQLANAAAQNQQLAQVVTVAEGAMVNVSATQNGNGGVIAIWSQVKTTVAGILKLMGGALGGNGGFVETSSKGSVVFGNGLVVDTSAPNGKAGIWLTDPVNIIVDSSAASLIAGALATTNVILDATGSGSGFGTNSSSGVPSITFLSGANVLSSNNASSLTLIATGGQIDINSTIQAGSISAIANIINLNQGGSLGTLGGAGGNVYLAGAILNILGNINSSGSTSGGAGASSGANANITTRRNNGINGGLISDANTYISSGNNITLLGAGDITIGANSQLTANGTTGGSITISSQGGNVNVSGIVDAVGKQSQGGNIYIAGQNHTNITGSLISVDGLSQAGLVQIGIVNNLGGSAWTLAPPAIGSPVNTLFGLTVANPAFSVLSQATSLDSGTGISASSPASNSTISAAYSNGGQIYIAGNLSLNSAATIEANADNGGFVLMSSPAGTYQNTGYIQTNGGAGLGGTIAVSGLTSTILTGAIFEANGEAGGGNIIIGRDFKNNTLSGSAHLSAYLPSLTDVLTLPTSALTYIDSATSLSANAGAIGDGGNILVWGDALGAYGAINAIGGSVMGNGGLIETSGNYLEVTSLRANAGSSFGTVGTWLLDPYDVTIGSLASGTAFSPSGSSYTYTPAGTSLILASDVKAALENNTNIAITTGSSSANTINVNSAIAVTTGSASLTLTALTINLAADITTYGAQQYSGAVTISGSARTLTTNNSNISFSSTINGAQPLTIANGSGALSITGVVGGTTALTSLTVSGSGQTSLGGNVTTTGLQYYGGNVVLSNTTMILSTTNSNVTIVGNVSTSVVTNIYILEFFNGSVSSTASLGGTSSGSCTASASVGCYAYSTDNGISYTILSTASTSPVGLSIAYSSSTGSFTLTPGILGSLNQYLVVGGGGGGDAGVNGSQWGSSGGAGAVIIGSGALASTNSYQIQVGSGGVDGNSGLTTCSPCVTATAGNSSSITSTSLSVTALGGQPGGGTGSAVPAISPKCTSGCPALSLSGLYVLAPHGAVGGTSGSGYLGGDGSATLHSQNPAAGGGGGAGGPGSAATGGIGISSSITGTVIDYGVGGNPYSSGVNAYQSPGSGGVYNPNSTSYGLSGIVVTQYSANSYASVALTISAGTGKVQIGSSASNTVQNLSSLTINSSNTGNALLGAVSGSTVVSYAGVSAGKLTISASNSYTGGTNVLSGTVITGSSTALGGATGSVVVSSGATLDLNGQTIANPLTISGSGVSSNGALINSSASPATYTGNLTVSANTSIGGTGAITLSGVVSAPTETINFVNAANVTTTNSSNVYSTVTGTNVAGINLFSSAALTVGATSFNGTAPDTYASSSSITQTGAISFGGTGGSSITFDTTSASKQNITLAGITDTSTNGMSVIAKSAGGSISAGSAMQSYGFIKLDNTNGNTVTIANATASTGVSVTGALSSGAYAGSTGVTVDGISNGGTGVNVTASVTTGNVGDITLTGISTTSNGVKVTGADIISNNGAINIYGTTTTTGAATASTNAAYIVNTTANIVSAATNINIAGYNAANTQGGVSVAGPLLAGGNITLGGHGASPGVSAGGTGPIYAGGNFTIEGASLNSSNVAQLASGYATATGAGAAAVLGSDGASLTISRGPNQGTFAGDNIVGAASVYGRNTYTAASNIYYGIQFYQASTVTGNYTAGSWDINGLTGGQSTGSAVKLNGGGTITSNNGSVTITGQTTSTAALYSGFAVVDDHGSTGTADLIVSNGGVYITGTSAVGTQLAVQLNGANITNTAINGAGVSIIANVGNLSDAATITSASGAGSVSLSAIGASAAVSTGSATITQNSDAGIYIASSNSGNVTSPKIINNGTGPVVIAAGTYLAPGDGTGGQITAVNGNTITSAGGNVYLYSGSFSSTTNLQYLTASLGSQTFNNTVFGQGYHSGGSDGAAATSVPDTSINIANIPNANTATGSTYGPVIQYRQALNYNLLLSSAAVLSKVYGTADPVATSGNLTNAGTLDYALNQKLLTTGNNAISGSNAVFSLTGTGTTFSATMPLANILNSISGTRVAGENVGTYNYTLTSSLRGISISTSTGASQPGTAASANLTITAAPLTITDSGASVVYNGTTGTYQSIVSTAGFTLTGLVSMINGVATGDAVTSVTQTIRTGSVIGSGTTTITSSTTPSLTTLVPQGTTYNAVPVANSAVGINLGNYSITYVGNTYSVTQPTIIITATANTKTYGATTTTQGVAYGSGSATSSTNLLGFSVSGSVLPTGVTITGVTLSLYSGASAQNAGQANVGTYTITPSGLTASGSLSGYLISYVSGTLTVTAAPITVSTNASSVYGSGTATAATPTVTGTLYNGNTITGATISAISGLATQNVGTYGSTVTTTGVSGGGGFLSSNYNITYNSGALTVTAAPLTITANAVNTYYGTPVTLGTSAYTSSGLKNSDAITGVTLQYSGSGTVAGTVNAATYTGGIVVSNASGTGLSNYNISYVPGNLVVAAAPITITAGNVVTTYGTAVTPTAYSITSGQLYNGNTLTGVTLGYVGTSTNVTSGTPNYGTYSGVNGIQPSAATLNAGTTLSNYAIAYANGSLTVNKATAIISATKVYDGSATFTAGSIGTFTVLGVNGQVLSVTGSGTANSPDVVTANTFQSLGTIALANGPSGATQGLASNYQLPSTTTLSITPLALTASVSSTITKTYDTTATTTLTAGNTSLTPSGTSTTSGSYTLSGFVSGQGAVITQTSGLYNSANATANSTSPATGVTATLISTNYVALSGTSLSNYSLPTSASGTGQINQASLTVSANPVTAFNGDTVTFSSIATGLLSGQTIAVTYTVGGTSVANPSVVTTSGTIAPVVTPSAVSGNYNITANTATLTVASNQDMVFTGYTTSKVYGQLSSGSNLATVAAPTVSYCATSSGTCVGHILSLILTAPSSGNIWTATDSASGASYTFALTNSATVSNYSAGGYLNVGTYTTTPGVASGTNGTLTVGTKYYNTGTLTVTPLTLTPVSSSAPSKVYDTTTAFATMPTMTVTALSGDGALSVSGTGAYNTANAGTGLGYTINNLALSGTGSGNYLLSTTTLLGTNGVITPAPLTLSGLVGNNKVYDATTAATISSTTQSLSGVLASDAANVLISSSGNYTGTFSSANAANGIAISAGTTVVNGLSMMTGVTLTGSAASNYYVSGPTSTLSANITKATVTISGTKVYDGTTGFAADELTVTGIGGQTLSFASGSGAANSANVGVANTLTSLGNLVLANGTGSIVGLSSNYTLISPTISSISITPASIVVTASNALKVYDATTAMPSGNVSGISTISTPSLVAGTLYTNASNGGVADSLSGGSFIFADPNAGSSNKTVIVSGVTVNDGNGGHNYSISYVNNTTSTITPAPVTINGASTYNGTTTVNNLTIAGVAGQTLSLIGGSATIASANAGTNAITTLSGGTLTVGGANPGNVANYTLVNPTLGSVIVSPASITVSATDAVKTFDNSLVATGSAMTQSPTAYVYSGALYGSDVLSGGSYAYTDVNAGSASKTVTVSGVSILNGTTNVSSNYTVSYINNTTSTINPASLTVSGLSVAATTYNGTNVATLAGVQVLSGVLPGTTVNLSGTATSGTFSTANAGTNLSVTPDLSGLSLTGSSASNYVLTGVTTPLTGSIAPAILTASIIGSPTMVYNATSINNSLASGNYQLSGFVSGQGAAISQSLGVYNSANVASANSITASLTPASFTANSGTLLSNYVLPTSATGAATITPAPITVSANNVVSFVGVSPNLGNQITVSGLQGTDTISTALTTSSITNNAPSTTPGVYPAALAPSATASSNYSIVGYTPGSLTIAAAGQLVLSISAANNTAVYGTYNSGNVSTAGVSALGNVTGQYCTNCAVGMNVSPIYVTLTVTQPSVGSNLWTAADNISPGTSAQGIYNFTVTPNVPSTAYSAGGNVNVGTYALTPANVTTVAGQATNYNTSLPVIYNSGTLTVTPLTLTFSAGPTTTYNGSTVINNASITPSNVLPGDAITVAVSGALTNPNANNGGAGYTLNSAVLSGSDAANYVFSNSASGTTGTNATVNPAPISVTASNAVKTYDTTTSTSGAGVAPILVSGSLYTNTSTGVADELVSVATVYSGTNASYAGIGNKTLTVSNAVIENGLLNATGNYSITYISNTTSTINPAPLTVSGLTAPSSIYNGSTATTISSGSLSLVGALPGASVTITGGTVTQGTLASPNAGSNIAVTPDLSGLTISNPNYVIVGPTTPLSTIVNPAPLTISGLTANSITYNGATADTISGTPTLIGPTFGQTVSISSGSVTSGTFATANAGSGIVVTANLSSLVLNNSNFTISGVTSPLTATIAPITLSATIIGAPSMQYNATTTDATLTSSNYQLSGFLSGQGATVSQAVGNFNSPNVASANLITSLLSSTNFTANSGTVLSNYVLPTSASGVGNITPAPLTMTVNNATTFIGVAPSLSYTLSGLQGADTAASVLTNAQVLNTAPANSGAGTYSGVLLSSVGGVSSNYSMQPLVSGNLTVASNYQLVITAANVTNVYGVLGATNQNTAISGVTAKYCTNCSVGTVSPTYINLSVSGSGNSWTASDSMGSNPASYAFTVNPVISSSSYSVGGSLAAGNYINVGNYVIQPSGVTTTSGTPNYNTTLPILYNNATLTITPYIISSALNNPSGGANSITQQYNGSTNINNAVLNLAGLPSGVSLKVIGSGSLANPNAGAQNYSITNLLLGGADAANFGFSGPLTGVATVTPAPITVSSSNVIKTFDNSTSTTGSNVSQAPTPVLLSGTLYSQNGVQDGLSGGTYVYTNANAGSGNKTIATSGVDVYNGATLDSSNYTITYVNNATSTINPAPLTISGLSAQARSYNATTDASLTGTPTIAGNTYGVSLTLSGTATSGNFASSNVGQNISVSPDLLGLSVNNSNFVIIGSTSALSSAITPAPLTINGLTASNKVYDATTTAVVGGTPTLVGNLFGQAVSLSGAVMTGSFASSNVAPSIAVNADLGGLVLNNPNFAITGTTTPILATITPAPITISGSMPYSGSTTVPTSGLVVTGVNGQTLNLAGGFGTVADTGPGVVSLLSVTGLSLIDGSGLASNYTVNLPVLTSVIIAASAQAQQSNAQINYQVLSQTLVEWGNSIHLTLTPIAYNSSNANTSIVQASNNPQSVSGGADISNNPTPQPNTAVGVRLSKLDNQLLERDVLKTSSPESFGFDLSGQVGVVKQSADISYEASLMDGSPLPGWLGFDSNTQSISAKLVPVESLPIQLKVKEVVNGKVVNETYFQLTKDSVAQ